MSVITAGILTKTQPIINAAVTALPKTQWTKTHVTLIVDDRAVTIPKRALGKLGKTFPKNEPLTLSLVDIINGTARALRIAWNTGSMLLKDEYNANDEPEHATAPLDFSRIVALLEETGTAKEKARRLLGIDNEQAKEKARDMCTKRAEDLASVIRYSKPVEYNGMSDIMESANKLEKALKKYAKMGGDYRADVQAILDKASDTIAQTPQVDAVELRQLEEKQREETARWSAIQSIVLWNFADDPRALTKAVRLYNISPELEGALAVAIMARKDAKGIHEEIEAEQKPRDLFVRLTGVAPRNSYAVQHWEDIPEPATITRRLQALLQRQEKINNAVELSERCKSIIKTVDALSIALTTPTQLRGIECND